MDNKNIWIVLIVLVAAVLIIPKWDGEAEGKANFKVEISVVETPEFAIVTGPKTKVGVNTLPFELTITNNGGKDLTNLRLGPGTIPNVLNNAFSGKSIISLPTGQSGTMEADVDVASLAPALGSDTFNFQAHIIADYDVVGETYTKTGFSDIMELTVSPEAGLTVAVTYE